MLDLQLSPTLPTPTPTPLGVEYVPAAAGKRKALAQAVWDFRPSPPRAPLRHPCTGTAPASVGIKKQRALSDFPKTPPRAGSAHRQASVCPGSGVVTARAPSWIRPCWRANQPSHVSRTCPSTATRATVACTPTLPAEPSTKIWCGGWGHGGRGWGASLRRGCRPRRCLLCLPALLIWLVGGSVVEFIHACVETGRRGDGETGSGRGSVTVG